MAILNWHSITKPQIWASSALPNDSSSPPLSQNPNLKLDRLPKPRLQPTLKQQKQPQPSILEIERAIGAGVFRDRDINSEAEEKANLFDNILKNTVGKNEGPLEKQLRETGEWLILQTEKTTRSAGKQILTTMFLWIIPMWMIALLVVSGVIPLPFDAPYLEDLIL